jgi:hypothetical protein
MDPRYSGEVGYETAAGRRYNHLRCRGLFVIRERLAFFEELLQRTVIIVALEEMVERVVDEEDKLEVGSNNPRLIIPSLVGIPVGA